MSVEQLKGILAASPRGPGFLAPPLEARAAFNLKLSKFAVPEDVKTTPISISGVRVVRAKVPESREDRVLLYFHGGAYIAGTPEGFLGLTAQLARSAGSTLYSVDYRLGPEHPFPAATDDAIAVYARIQEKFGAEQIIVAGDSAGGGLALALLLAARDQGLPQPAGAILLSPWVDLTLRSAISGKSEDRDPLLSIAALSQSAHSYLSGSDPEDHLASPLFANLENLAPISIHVGTEEVLQNDARQLHDRLLAASGASTLKVWSGMVHDWALFWQFGLDEAIAVIAEFGETSRSLLSS